MEFGPVCKEIKIERYNGWSTVNPRRNMSSLSTNRISKERAKYISINLYYTTIALYMPVFVDITVEGIFRRTGALSRQQELRSLLNQGVTLNLDDGTYSVHDCASVLKGFLAELPEPLLTEMHYPAFCQIAGM